MKPTLIAIGTGIAGLFVGAYLFFRFLSRALDGIS